MTQPEINEFSRLMGELQAQIEALKDINKRQSETCVLHWNLTRSIEGVQIRHSELLKALGVAGNRKWEMVKLFVGMLGSSACTLAVALLLKLL